MDDGQVLAPLPGDAVVDIADCTLTFRMRANPPNYSPTHTCLSCLYCYSLRAFYRPYFVLIISLFPTLVVTLDWSWGESCLLLCPENQ
jgi:hypothetical protein